MNVALHPRPALDVISLCTGGGGLDLALDLAIPGARSVVMVEREAFAVAHLVAAMDAGLLAPSPIWSDVRSFDGRPWRGLVDGLIGGIPCQPHSLAGRKRGSLDERDLWSSTRRIIAQARPWFVLIENVAGMLAAGDDDIAGAERVWRDLRRLGFAVEVGLFTAEEVGDTQEGERLFILGVAEAGRAGFQGSERAGSSRERDWEAASRPASELRGACLVSEVLASSDRDGLERHAEPHIRQIELGKSPSRRSDAERRHPALFPPFPEDRDGWRDVLHRSPDLEPAVRRMVDGLPARVDLSGPHAARVERLRMLGNGVVPLQGGYAIRTLLARHAARGSARAAELLRMTEAAR